MFIFSDHLVAVLTISTFIMFAEVLLNKCIKIKDKNILNYTVLDFYNNLDKASTSTINAVFIYIYQKVLRGERAFWLQFDN